MTQVTPLRTFAQVTLDGSGNGQVSIGPSGVESWQVQRVAVTVSSATLEPTAKIYRNHVSPASFIGGTYAGSNDADTDLHEQLQPGDTLIAVWEDGDAGATAALTVGGLKVS